MEAVPWLMKRVYFSDSPGIFLEFGILFLDVCCFQNSEGLWDLKEYTLSNE